MNVETKYLRMIQGMKRRGERIGQSISFSGGMGSLYTGIAKDVRVRFNLIGTTEIVVGTGTE